MDTVRTIAAMRLVRTQLAEPVGFVPTMGSLHEGHLSLIRRALVDNASVAVSIFVNPTQFGPGEDLMRYPRDIPRDLAMLANEGADAVFVPDAAEMYPTNFTTWVTVEKPSERLEGAVRPGHFRGVATICAKLFNIIRPARVYFGQKDAQQVLVIKRLATDLNLDLDIVTLPTVRAPDGLALSSRNAYLGVEERQAATVLSRALRLAETRWLAGERRADVLRREMAELIQTEPMAQIDYISFADGETLTELETASAPALISLAVYIGQNRLIDNLVLPQAPY
ncbi:MAG: pantoate--beta-alanine ligase [Dehalococcoidia bacterium]|nr:pantoate--beta-alanine ligase [Dehalococcoidia bacterium]